jgi:soluble lytic murein transglycosylase-like protein
LSEAQTERRKVENYLAVKYNVSQESASVLAGHFYDAAERAEKRYNVEIDMTVLVAMGHTESRFRSNAVSWAGAVGIMQVVPRYHLDRYVFLERREDLLVPRLNIRAGTFIFAEALAKYDDTRKAVRAYHGGARGVSNPRPSTVAYERTIYERLQQLRVTV